MRHKRNRARIAQRKLLRKTITLVSCAGIIFTLGFGIKDIFFNKNELVQASQEDFQPPDKNASAGENASPSAGNPADDIESNTDNVNDAGNTAHTEDGQESENGNGDIGKDSQEDINRNDNGNGDEKDSGNDGGTNGKNNEKNESINKDNYVNENAYESKVEISLDSSVFIGDSITEALSYYKFINYSRVIASKGFTAKKAMAEIDNVVNLNPDRIFILLGLNDILTERNADRFIKNYTNLVQELKKRLPDADIYIQSILPVDPKVETSKLALSNSMIEECNNGLIALAQQEDVTYLDIASIAKNYGEDIREADGIHYKSKFCTLWLEYIKENI